METIICNMEHDFPRHCLGKSFYGPLVLLPHIFVLPRLQDASHDHEDKYICPASDQHNSDIEDNPGGGVLFLPNEFD